jgi:hypothetical protein
LHMHCRGAKIDAYGRSFEVLSAHILIVNLRLRHKILAWCPGRCSRRHAVTWSWCAGRCAARCFLHVLGRIYAVLSTKASTVGLRLRHSRLACGSMLEASRDAVAAVDV